MRLTLQRRRGEQIVIGDDIVIEVLSVRGDSVRLGITAPREVRVDREEVRREREREKKSAPPLTLT